MEQRRALDDGFSSMSRREIRALRREFAKLDRLGVHEHETLDHVPEQRSRAGAAPAAQAGAAPSRDEPGGSSLSVGEAQTRLRWGVVLLLLIGVLMMAATVGPGGWSRTESVPPAPSPSTAPAAPLDPTEPGAQFDAPPGRFGTPSQAPTTPEFTFRGPFGP